MVDFEDDEVGLVLRHIFAKLLCIVFSRKAVGVVAVGQQQHLHIHVLCQKHIRSPECGMYSRLIPIVDKRDVVGESFQQSDLCIVECSS